MPKGLEAESAQPAACYWLASSPTPTGSLGYQDIAPGA